MKEKNFQFRAKRKILNFYSINHYIYLIMKILIDCTNLKFKIKNLKFKIKNLKFNRLLQILPTYIEDNKLQNNFYFNRILFLKI